MFGIKGGVQRIRLVKWIAVPTVVAALLASAGQAHAADRAGRGGGGKAGGGGGGHGHGHGSSGGHRAGHSGHHHGGHSGHSGYRNGGYSGFGLGINLGAPFCGPRYYAPSYCAPAYAYPDYYRRSYCETPYYSPSIGIGFSTAIGSTYISGSYSTPLYAPSQVVVQQPIVVPQPPVAVRPADSVLYALRPQQAASVPVPSTEPDTGEGRYRDRELGDAYMHVADFQNASRAYSRYLSAWAGDGTAARGLGVALIGAGDAQNGFRAVANGYKAEPSLFSRPMTSSDFGGPAAFQRVMDAAVHAADSANTPEGWFTVSVLNHTAGNKEAARTASTRARDAGLDTASLDSLTLMVAR